MYHHDYKLIPASKTAELLCKKGSTLDRLIIVPATTGAGAVSLLDTDGTTTVTLDIYKTGTLADLSPMVVEFGAQPIVGDFKLTTGANVSVIAVGRFV